VDKEQVVDFSSHLDLDPGIFVKDFSTLHIGHFSTVWLMSQNVELQQHYQVTRERHQ